MQLFRTTRAFTLVEMIVSLAIFSIVAVVALGALTKIVSANKKAQAIQVSINNISVMLDVMSRELRTGSTYNCDTASLYTYFGDSLVAKSCDVDDAPEARIAFISSTRVADVVNGSHVTCPGVVIYRFIDPENDGTWDIEKMVQSSCTEIINESSGNYRSMINPSKDDAGVVDSVVVITGYHMAVSDDVYPHATIYVSGYVGVKEKEKVYFDVQTLISSRQSE